MKLPKTIELTHEDVVKEVAIKIGKDRRVVDVVSRHFFNFIAECIRDTDNVKPIRLRYFCVFAIRNKVKKK